MTGISTIYYKAAWGPSLASLNPGNRTTIQKVVDLIKRVIFFIPNGLMEPLVRWCVLPSSSPFMKKIFQIANTKFKHDLTNRPVLAQHIVSELEVTTPDGIVLKGHFFKHPQHDQDPQARVLLAFHGNGDFYQSGSIVPLMDCLNSPDCKVPYSFVCFNPRGVGNSIKGTPNENTLLIDAESIYQTMTQALKIPESQIDIYGHSLGGAQGAQLKKLHSHTGGGLFLDRTFSKLDKMVAHVLGTSIIGRIAQKIVKKYDWEFDTYHSLQTIKDRIYVFTHEHDGIIPQSCSLSNAIKQHPLANANIQSFEFKHSYSNGAFSHSHMDPLPTCFGLTGTNTAQKSAKELKQETKELLLNCFNPARQHPAANAG